MDSKKSLLTNRWLQMTAGLCTAVLLYIFVSHIDVLLGGLGAIWKFVSPVVTAIIIAYVMNPLSDFLEVKILQKVRLEKKSRHNISVLCTALIVVMVLVLLMSVLIPQLWRSATYLAGHIGVYSAQLQGLVNRIAGEYAAKNVKIDTITSIFNQILQKITSSITGNYDSLVTASVSVGRQLLNFGVAFILAIYFLMDKEKLILGVQRLLHAVLKESTFKTSMDFLERCHRILIRYIAYDLLDGIAVGMVNYLVMKILGMPYAGLISIVVGATNLAPTFGPIVGGVIGAFILLLVNPFQALIFIGVTVVLQTCDGYILKPKLFGETFGVSPIWILIFIILGGRMFGMIGILLGIPMAAIMSFMYEEMVIARLERRKEKNRNNGMKAAESNIDLEKINDSDYHTDGESDTQNLSGAS